MKTLRALFLAGAVGALAACGELSAELDRAKQGAVDLSQEALSVGAQVLDTRSACMLAGQSASFCTCLSERLGPELSPERVQAVLGEAARAAFGGGAAAAEGGGADAQSRDAVLACAARAAVQGVLSEGGN